MKTRKPLHPLLWAYSITKLAFFSAYLPSWTTKTIGNVSPAMSNFLTIEQYALLGIPFFLSGGGVTAIWERLLQTTLPDGIPKISAAIIIFATAYVCAQRTSEWQTRLSLTFLFVWLVSIPLGFILLIVLMENM